MVILNFCGYVADFMLVFNVDIYVKRFVQSRFAYSQRKLHDLWKPLPFQIGNSCTSARHRGGHDAAALRLAGAILTRPPRLSLEAADCVALVLFSLGIVYGPIYPPSYLITAIGLGIKYLATRFASAQPRAECTQPSHHAPTGGRSLDLFSARAFAYML